MFTKSPVCWGMGLGLKLSWDSGYYTWREAGSAHSLGMMQRKVLRSVLETRIETPPI